MTRLATGMLSGTPLLIRTVDERNQEKLQICSCQVDARGQVMTLVEQDGRGHTREIKINTIAAIEEDASASADDGNPCTIRLKFKGGQRPMELICAAPEDFEIWRDGLRSLIGSSQSPSAGQQPPARKAPLSPSSIAGLSKEGITQLIDRLALQEELIGELRTENSVLNEMVKQKDAVIQQLTADIQKRGSKSEHCNKTESTSRESDDHLRDRETAILKRENLRLKKVVQKKKKTITNLMQTLQSALGGQTSDGDALHSEDDNNDSDLHEAAAVNGSALAAPAASDSGSEPEAIREEVRALTSKLMRLEREVEEGLEAAMQPETVSAPQRTSPKAQASTQRASPTNGGRFQPPARQVASSPSAAQQRAAMAAAHAAKSPQGMAAFDFSAVGGAPPAAGSMSKESKAALESLAKEMAVLEQKKRAVEALAKTLEPESDNEDDDDGFPLQ